MAYPQGINFRLTSGAVTDGALESVEVGNYFNPTYPRTTPQGNTVGWEGSVDARDRSGSDPRLFGNNFSELAQRDFRFDLPSAGSYKLRMACGDMAFDTAGVNWSLVDGTTSLGTLTSGATTAGNFKDATDVLHSAANWPSANAFKTASFATTICRIRSGSATNNVIAHAYVEAAAAPAGTAVDPAVGTVALTGYAPTVAQSANQSVTPAAGSLAITGYAPTIAQPQAVSPDVGALSITGYAPTVTQAVNQAVNPNVGTISITGYAPGIAQSANQLIAPDAGSVALTGYAPSVAQSAHQAIVPGVGALSITGYAPSVVQESASRNVLPDVGSLTITGYAPVVAQSSPSTKVGGDDVPTRGKRERIEIWEVRKKKPKPAPIVEEVEVEEVVEPIAEIEPKPIPRQPLTIDERAQAQKLASALVYKPVPLQTVPGIIAQKIELAPDFDLVDEDEEEALLMLL